MGLRDVETGKPVMGHGGTVGFNPHRKKWVMIALQTFGRSMLGEVWFAEADTLLGPWGYARRIVTHDRYSFYNVKHHPYFSAGGGRWIYFEGTYTAMFSGAKSKTPRYDYNQIMYRLDLDDPRLRLPVPVYEVGAAKRLLVGGEVATSGGWSEVRRVAFWALPGAGGEAPRYRVLPVDDGRSGTKLLYRWSNGEGVHRMEVQGQRPGEGWTRQEAPVGRVWPAVAARPPLPSR